MCKLRHSVNDAAVQGRLSHVSWKAANMETRREKANPLSSAGLGSSKWVASKKFLRVRSMTMINLFKALIYPIAEDQTTPNYMQHRCMQKTL
ncbi:hypothetical protein E2320_009917 [Naja naja]|nr:hypothetical protein E2320_009917 [Naja naja]